MTELSVVIPTYERPESLRQLLLALGEQSLAADRFEVIVAMDGMGNASAAATSPVPMPYALHWTNGPRAGPGTTRNRGAALASGDVLLFLDDDMMPAPTLLAEHLAVHGDAPDRVCLGRVRVHPELRLSPWEAYLNRRFEAHYDKMDRSGYQPSFWDCLSGNLSLPRRLFVGCGGFDPRFAITKHEDIELGYRLATMGAGFVYQPRALSLHRLRKTLAEGLRDAVENGASAVRFARYHPALAPWLIAARWQRYSPAVRQFMRWAMARPRRQASCAKLAAQLLGLTERLPMPSGIARPLCQLAYHIHFWEGAQAEARPGELNDLLAQAET